MQSTTISLPSIPSWRVMFPVVIVALCGVLAVYWQTAYSIGHIWWRSETFAHGFLILPIVIWLLWQRRKFLAEMSPHFEAKAIPLGLASSVVWLVAHETDILVVQQLMLVAMLIAVIWAFLGTPLAKAMAFPLGFLFTAVPMGEVFIPYLMEYTADFTVAALQLTGMPVYREGLFFEIPSGRWSVVEGCSGLRYLIASFTLGLLYAYLTYRSLLRRTLFVVASIIVPIVANGLRAFMIVMIGHYSDMKLAMGVDHYIYGWVFFGIVMLLLFWVGTFWREDIEPVAETRAVTPRNSSKLSAPLPVLGMAVVIAVVVFGQGIAWWLNRASTTHDTHTSLRAPAATGDWQLAPIMWDWRPRYRGQTSGLHQGYKQHDMPVAMSIEYYAEQRQDAELINSQNVMVEEKHPVWGKVGEKIIEIEYDGKPFQIRQTELYSPQQRLLVWDWFWVEGNITANPYMAKWYGAKARLTQGRARAAGVILATSYEERGTAAHQRLQAFVKTMRAGIEERLVNAEGA